MSRSRLRRILAVLLVGMAAGCGAAGNPETSTVESAQTSSGRSPETRSTPDYELNDGDDIQPGVSGFDSIEAFRAHKAHRPAAVAIPAPCAPGMLMCESWPQARDRFGTVAPRLDAVASSFESEGAATYTSGETRGLMVWYWRGDGLDRRRFSDLAADGALQITAVPSADGRLRPEAMEGSPHHTDVRVRGTGGLTAVGDVIDRDQKLRSLWWYEAGLVVDIMGDAAAYTTEELLAVAERLTFE